LTRQVKSSHPHPHRNNFAQQRKVLLLVEAAAAAAAAASSSVATTTTRIAVRETVQSKQASATRLVSSRHIPSHPDQRVTGAARRSIRIK